ncbi:PQ-loop domain-containing transporter [Legionella cardiaca]|uniref:PQ-loop domain-containing transporter n=1 Tax=Legionella cardiaca TaxID=1071983 RepID=A0ABY8ARM1_9GAMM|nr:PQ-loop domain-containing transporter [Legionella cardiaca]WED43323.1 PQ-loop domain-containing transporter [Legionella cardiaca]
MMELFVNVVCYFGLLCGALRVLPQTYKTLRTKEISNISLSFFSCHFFAGICGLIYELITITSFSIAHFLFFCMVILTNAIQITYTLYLQYSGKNNLSVDLGK